MTDVYNIVNGDYNEKNKNHRFTWVLKIREKEYVITKTSKSSSVIKVTCIPVTTTGLELSKPASYQKFFLYKLSCVGEIKKKYVGRMSYCYFGKNLGREIYIHSTIYSKRLRALNKCFICLGESWTYCLDEFVCTGCQTDCCTDNYGNRYDY